MAKLKGPLFSLDAHGTLGNALTFSSRRSGSQVRFQKKQTDFKSAPRAIQRGYFSMGMGWWGELTANEQAEWLVIGRTDC